MKENDIVVCFVNTANAEYMLKKTPEIKEALVISDVIPEENAVVVRKDEFLAWLYEHEKEKDDGKND